MDWSLSSYDNLKIKISTENTQQYVALQEGFIMDRLRLEILMKIFKIIFN